MACPHCHSILTRILACIRGKRTWQCEECGSTWGEPCTAGTLRQAQDRGTAA